MKQHDCNRFADNQGMCHKCGKPVNLDRWVSYFGGGEENFRKAIDCWWAAESLDRLAGDCTKNERTAEMKQDTDSNEWKTYRLDSEVEVEALCVQSFTMSPHDSSPSLVIKHKVG